MNKRILNKRIKLLMALLIICAISLNLCNSCTVPDLFIDYPSHTWMLKNSTNDTLTYLIYKHNNPVIERIGKIGKTAILLYREENEKGFDSFYDEYLDSVAVKCRGKILKTWRVADTLGDEKHLFRQTDWTADSTYRYEKQWIFEILPEHVNLPAEKTDSIQ